MYLRSDEHKQRPMRTDLHRSCATSVFLFDSTRLEIYKERAHERGERRSEWVCVPRVCEAISP